MLTLSAGLAGRGYGVDLVLAVSEGPYMSQVPADVRLVELEASRTLTTLPALVRYLRRERPRAMVAALSRANIVALWARRITGIPECLVVSEHNTISVLTKNAPQWRVRVIPLLARYFYRWASTVVAVSQGVADDFVEFVGIPRELVKVVFNPVVTPELLEKAAQPLAHPWFGEGEPPVLLAVGSLTPQKDFGVLLQAVARVVRKRPARCIILGEGQERGRLEALVRELGLEEQVSLPGFVENPYAYMARSSVYVLSSRWEGLPTVLVEALACGASIVATDCPSGPREILRNGEFGELVPVGQPEQLAAAIERVLAGSSPPPPPESWQPFTLEPVVDQYLDLLLDRSSLDYSDSSSTRLDR
jgi:glycosyltransferase involved in cell wall biosynthesis